MVCQVGDRILSVSSSNRLSGVADRPSTQVDVPGEKTSCAFVPGNYTVYVLDSDEQFCSELTALLERAGYRVQAFQSACDLITAVTAHPENAGVITEMELPGMTGLDLISRFRKENLRVPVMILTSLGDVATAVRAMRARVADYLLKPYVERDLINRLRIALLKQYQPYEPSYCY